MRESTIDVLVARAAWRDFCGCEAARMRAVTDQVRRELAQQEERLLERVPEPYRLGRRDSIARKPLKAGQDPVYVAGYADGLLAEIGVEP